MTTSNSTTALQLEGAIWRKSSHSGSSEGQCVEIADVVRTHQSIAVRDSKDPAGPALLCAPEAFQVFVSAARCGIFGN
ncbi:MULTISPECIES: DUF397 domain-containing protein [Streptomyces]|uniref:DUF397 domain-containing protein n=1 Tax=Streptomyces TaxID=1883 RepID=UPI0004BDC5EB|nr:MULTISPECIES: DUF397 domain-containing protein [unclassified Streptomyces]